MTTEQKAKIKTGVIIGVSVFLLTSATSWVSAYFQRRIRVETNIETTQMLVKSQTEFNARIDAVEKVLPKYEEACEKLDKMDVFTRETNDRLARMEENIKFIREILSRKQP